MFKLLKYHSFLISGLMSPWKLLLSVFVLLFFASDLRSQAANFEIEYPYSDYIHNLHIDEATGYIWGVTKEDIILFDGNGFVPLQFNNYIKKSPAHITLGAFYNNRYLFPINRTLVSLDFRTKEVKEIWEAPGTHRIWKVHRDKKDSSVWVFAQAQENKKITGYKFNQAFELERSFELPDFGIESIFQAFYVFKEADGLFYFYGPHNGLFIFDKAGKEVQLEVQGEFKEHDWKMCHVFRLDNKGNLWRIAGKRYERYNKVNKSFVLHPLSGKFSASVDCEGGKIAANLITTIYEDLKGRIWLGYGDSHLFYYDALKDELISFRQELIDELQGGGGNVKSLKEDKDGNLWGNKRGGLFKIREKEKYFDSYLVDADDKEHTLYKNGKNPFINKVVDFYKESGIERSKIQSISEDDNEDLYFQDYRFSYRLKKGSDNVEVLPFFKEKGNRSIYADKDVKLLSVWNSYYTFDSTLTLTKKSAPIKEINSTFRRSNGDLFVSGKLDGKGQRLLAKLNPTSYEFEGNFIDTTEVIDFGYYRMYSIDEDVEDHLLFGSNAGFLKVHDREGYKEHFIDSFIYKKDTINLNLKGFSVYYQDKDYVWIKTENEVGLLNTRTKEFKYLLHKSDIDISSILSLLPIDDTSVWVGDYEGLFHYDFESKKMIRFYENEGFGEDAYVEKITKLQDGRLAIGSANGLYIAHLDSLHAIKKRIETMEGKYAMKLSSYSYLDGKTEELNLNDFVMEHPQDIHLHHNDKILKLKYFLNNHNSHDRQTYSYKLEGFDKDWSTRTRSNVAIYASIPPGKYTFMARGAASGDNWSKQLLSIPIIVHEAWYKTWWFYALILLAVIMGIYSWSKRHFKQRIKKRNEIERLRNKISRDLHDDVGTLLSSLAWQTDVISLSSDEEAKKKFSKVSGLSRIAMDRMRDAVWAIDSQKDNTLSLVERMLDFLADQFEDRDKSFSFDHDDFTEADRLTPDVRQNVYLIFKEAVTNALKHSKGDQLKIALNRKDGRLQLLVRDNGGTVEERDIKKSGLGLASMRKRASRINAQLVQSWEGGCTVQLTI